MVEALAYELDASLSRALAAVRAKTSVGGVRRVWIDIGTWRQTLSKADLEADESLIVIGLEALAANLNSSLHPVTPRFVRVLGACSDGPAGTFVTFQQHTSPSCGSLLPTHRSAPRVGKGSDACVGDVPRPVRVRSVPLSLLIDRVRAVLHARIELVKIDVQGSEVDCVASAAASLRSVDNLLLEAQVTFHGLP